MWRELRRWSRQDRWRDKRGRDGGSGQSRGVNSTIVPSHAMSAVRGDVPTGTTAEKMCQSPKRDSWVTTVLVDEVMSEGDEDSASCFSQPERVKSTVVVGSKLLKFLQSVCDFFRCRFSGRLAACR